MSKNKKERTHVLSTRIDDKSVGDAIRFIANVNSDDDYREKEYRKYKRKPIHLILNTYGGSVYDGLGLIGAIERSKTPVHITVMGTAMSMGLFILAAGHKRIVSRHATLMYHQLSVFLRDKLEGIKDAVKESERLEKVCETILFERTGLTPKHLQPYKTQKKEWYLGAEEAKKLKIIDKII
ncbi:MAG: hypothetical protein D6722_11040 [Bacteroidetes bacterium]|nr:MAG: hypothetical protein D6722_11040 [Bacteroidota bacterium]